MARALDHCVSVADHELQLRDDVREHLLRFYPPERLAAVLRAIVRPPMVATLRVNPVMCDAPTLVRSDRCARYALH